MEMFLLILRKEEYLDQVLEAMIEAEIEAISIIEATEAKKVLAEDIPIFAGIIQAAYGIKGIHQIIIGITDNMLAKVQLIEVLTDLVPEININEDLRIFRISVLE